jgi:hypothetical protein
MPEKLGFPPMRTKLSLPASADAPPYCYIGRLIRLNDRQGFAQRQSRRPARFGSPPIRVGNQLQNCQSARPPPAAFAPGWGTRVNNLEFGARLISTACPPAMGQEEPFRMLS